MKKEFKKMGKLAETMTRSIERVEKAYAAANSVLGIYEDEYPGDDRPRKALEAAKIYFILPRDEKNSNNAAEALYKCIEAAVWTPASVAFYAAEAAMYAAEAAMFAAGCNYQVFGGCEYADGALEATFNATHTKFGS